MPTPCFWLEPTDLCKVGLRRYIGSNKAPCPGPAAYHNALAYLGTVPLRRFPGREALLAELPGCSHWFSVPGNEDAAAVPDFDWPPHDDPRWPQACGCGYEFAPCTCGQTPCREDPPAATYQQWSELLYTVTAAMPGAAAQVGDLVTTRDAPEGAMWDAFWYPWKGPDGRSLAVKVPGDHDWLVDSRASNCTRPDDREHRCWVRHGEVPNITVDKNGDTCAAGAGSIQAGAYHGFLRGGVLT